MNSNLKIEDVSAIINNDSGVLGLSNYSVQGLPYISVYNNEFRIYIVEGQAKLLRKYLIWIME